MSSENAELTSTDPAVPGETTEIAGPVPGSEHEISRVFDWESLSLLLLILILGVGAYFRFTGIDWDDSFHLHPDERFLTDLASLLKPTYDPFTYLRTSESPLNPYNVGKSFYVYGNFPMTATRFIAEWATLACSKFDSLCQHVFNSYDGIHLVGRALSGAVDLLSLLFLFLIGRRLYDWRVGLLAAALQALAVMPIQQSHFFTMDNWAAALTTIAIYASVRVAGLGEDKPLKRKRMRWWLLFGLTLGLAVASRVNLAPLAVVINIAAVIWLARRGYSWQTVWASSRGRADLSAVFLGIALSAAVALITFRLAQPFAFADREIVRNDFISQTGQEPGPFTLALRSAVGFNPQWRSNMDEIQRLQKPDASFPPALQWTDRKAILFPLSNMILVGMGLTAGIAAWLGLMWALWRTVRGRPEWQAHAIPLFWSGAYFLFMGTRWVKSVRYFLPIYPTLFLLAAWAVFAVTRNHLLLRHPRAKKAVLATVLAALLIPSFLWANAFVQIYRQPMTRIAASDWMFKHVPSGATILYDSDGKSRQLQLPLKQFEFLAGAEPLRLLFSLPEAGTITAFRLNYLTDLADHADLEGEVSGSVMQVSLNQEPPVLEELAPVMDRAAVTIELGGVAAAADSPQQVTVSLAEGGPLRADTSYLIVEHWDDLLPVRLDGRNGFGSYYGAVTNDQVPVTHPDSPSKRQQVIEWLDQADYVILSSQRAVWHLPRLPLMYPVMIRYYEGLFRGDLGFELEADFHAQFHVGPLFFSDTTGQLGWGAPPDVGWPPPGALAAEEAFSVYDHPPVWIFGKTDSYDRNQLVSAFGQLDLSQTVSMTPGEATSAPNGLLLSSSDFAEQRANGSFDVVFSVDGLLSRNPALAAAVWWIAVVAMGWLAFPIAFVVMPGLPDRGYALARILSLLLVSYLSWLMASLKLLPSTRGSLILGILLVGAVGLLILRGRWRSFSAFLRQNYRYILVAELLGVLLYLLLIGVRLGNPDVWDVIWGGEKPMDLAYFTAVLKSTTFPPYDPWFAGGYINYYYYGFVYVGALAKLLGVVPTLAYNLILPMLFSFTGLGIFALAYNLVARNDHTTRNRFAITEADIEAAKYKRSFALNRRAIVAGLVALTLAVLLGNLAELGVLLDAWYKAGNAVLTTGLSSLDTVTRVLDGAIKVLSGQPAPIGTGDWFWNASRAINYLPGEVAPITEFPFFTFLYGDLHAHMISMPLMLLALGWSIGLGMQYGKESSAGPWATGLKWLVGGIAIGVLRATNTWDWPTYLAIGGLAVTYHVYRRNGRLNVWTLGQAGCETAVIFTLSILAFLPYADNYGVGYTSFKLWPGSYTYLSNYFYVYGLFLVLIVTYLGVEFRAWTSTWTMSGKEKMEPFAAPIALAILIYLVLILNFTIKGYYIVPVVMTLVLCSGLLSLRKSLPPPRRIVLALISAALALTIFVELFVLDGDIGRMNTVFKFYMQVWLILSVVSGAAVVWSWPAIVIHRKSRRYWQALVLLLMGIAALYPILATKAKWDIRMSHEAPTTLDGMAFMPYVEYGDSGQIVSLTSDYEALQWIFRNIKGSPVIAEAHSSNPYRSVGNRIAMYTGLPTIVGWDWHQRQQRAVLPGQFVSNRIQDVQRLYQTTVIPEAVALLEKYEVEYIYSGELERVYYSAEGLEKFDRMVEAGLLDEVYQNGNTSIYRVVN